MPPFLKAPISFFFLVSTEMTDSPAPCAATTLALTNEARHPVGRPGVTIVNGAVSSDHVHMFVEIPPHVSVSDFVRRAKGRSSRKIQQEFEHIRKRYWGQRFWQRGYFSTTSGNITDDIIMRYLDRHTHKEGFSPSA